jgi:hypothetical protein
MTSICIIFAKKDKSIAQKKKHTKALPPQVWFSTATRYQLTEIQFFWGPVHWKKGIVPGTVVNGNGEIR